MPVQTETAGAVTAAVSPLLQTLTPSSEQTRPCTVELLCRHGVRIHIRSFTKKFLFESKYFPCKYSFINQGSWNCHAVFIILKCMETSLLPYKN